MAYIPEDARWYLAELVVEFRIEGEIENLVHINIVLVEAASPDQAYEKAMSLGRDHQMNYTNTDGKSVAAIFRGLRDLNVIHGELEHGTELIYEKLTGLPESRVAGLVSGREDLGVFAPVPS